MTSSTSEKTDDAAIVLPEAVVPVADKKDESAKTAPASNDKK